MIAGAAALAYSAMPAGSLMVSLATMYAFGIGYTPGFQLLVSTTMAWPWLALNHVFR
jgi:hypothetical protein